MTEREWLTTETKPRQMLGVCISKSVRTHRLAACGLCRLIETLIPQDPYLRLLDQIERDVDVSDELSVLRATFDSDDVLTTESTAIGAVLASAGASDRNAVWMVCQWVERAVDLSAPRRKRTAIRKTTVAGACNVLREAYGNPFRPRKRIATWMGGGWACPDGTLFFVPTVARELADRLAADHNFADLPVLADALDDAGCPDAELVTHLRHGTGHRAGCWALDLVRGVA